jgi:hypothetical protein
MQTTEEDEVINWGHDFGINELLHHTAQKIASTYGLLRYNYKDHPDNATWAKLSLEWVTYDTKKIRTFNFATQQEGEAEVDRLVAKFKEAELIDRNLKQSPIY